jgi:hypothetical protein
MCDAAVRSDRVSVSKWFPTHATIAHQCIILQLGLGKGLSIGLEEAILPLSVPSHCEQITEVLLSHCGK